MPLAPDHISRQQTKGLWSRCGWLQSPFPQPLPGCWRSEHRQKETTFLPGVSKWVLALTTPDIAFYFDCFLNFLMKIFLASCSYFWVSSCHNTYSLIIRLWAHWEQGPNFIPFLPSSSCFFPFPLTSVLSSHPSFLSSTMEYKYMVGTGLQSQWVFSGNLEPKFHCLHCTLLSFLFLEKVPELLHDG